MPVDVSTSVPDIPLQAALFYASLGWHIFPLSPNSKIPATPRGYHNSTTNPDQIKEWWNTNPRFGIGLDCAASKIIGIDIDPRNGGYETLKKLEEKLGPLPTTITNLTGFDGKHLLFIGPDGVIKIIAKLGPGVDIKLNGYLVIPPSVHPKTKKRYQWLISPGSQPLANLPQAWVDAIVVSKPVPQAPTAPYRKRKTKSTHYGLAALDDECVALRNTSEGNRNNKLNQAAYALIGLVEGNELDESDTYNALYNAAIACGLEEKETKRTIQSGFQDGRSHPRSAPQPDLRLIKNKSSPQPEAPIDWEDGLAIIETTDGKNKLAKTPGNLALILSNHKDWKDCLGFNELSYRAEWLEPPPEIAGRGLAVPHGQVSDEHCTYVRHWFRKHWGIDFGQSDTQAAVDLSTQTHRFHPVQKYLNSLVWDNKARVHSWLEYYLGVQTSDQISIGKWWIISAVARAFRPGCQADHILILEGPQGIGKSSALRILAGSEFYQGKLGNISDKDGAQSLLGSWIIEIGELDAFKGKDATRIKDFLTQTVDRYRPTYGRYRVDRPRSCVFCGTTNDATYLHDPTGARRFWPVTLGEVHLGDLEKDRDMIWAEALHLYQQGERWYPVGLEENKILADNADERLATDTWEEKLLDFMTNHVKQEWTTREILTDIIEMPLEKQSRYDSMRIGLLLRRMGYKRQRRLHMGRQVYMYLKNQ